MQRQTIRFLRKNVWRMVLVILLLVVASKKDMRFHLNLNRPAQTSSDNSTPAKPIASNHTDSQKAAIMERFQFRLFPVRRSSKSADRTTDPVPELDPRAQDAFVRRFARVAIAERKKFGIPSSYILANGLLHSRAGYDPRVQLGNNYFGIPCTPDWRGATIRVEGKCYRAYETPWMSFRDHSLFVATGPHSPDQPPLPTDYVGWADATIAKGYPANKRYEKAIVELIEELQLFLIDEQP